MDQQAFLREQFVSLRHEIEGQQRRLFWTVLIGLIGMPTLAYVTWDATTLVWMILPFLVLVFIVLFLAQQNYMMRAGRYIRERIEVQVPGTVGWESWLESRPELRVMDRHFSACFLIIFFGYYFLQVAMATHRLWIEAVGDPSGLYWYWFYSVLIAYVIATIWVLTTLAHHWKSSVSTSSTQADGETR